MKTIKDSGENHWALLQQVECSQCRTVFQAESNEDFRDYFGGMMNYVWMTCPRCSREQKVFKKRNTPIFHASEPSLELVQIPKNSVIVKT